MAPNRRVIDLVSDGEGVESLPADSAIEISDNELLKIDVNSKFQQNTSTASSRDHKSEQKKQTSIRDWNSSRLETPAHDLTRAKKKPRARRVVDDSTDADEAGNEQRSRSLNTKSNDSIPMPAQHDPTRSKQTSRRRKVVDSATEDEATESEQPDDDLDTAFRKAKLAAPTSNSLSTNSISTRDCEAAAFVCD